MCKGCGRADMAAMVAARSLDTNPNTLPSLLPSVAAFLLLPHYSSWQQHMSYCSRSHWRRAA